MNTILAITTSTPQVGVALGGGDGPIASVHVRQGRRHGELVAPAIASLAQLAGVGLEAVEAVAVDVGPGLFTGLRVGVATAKALASALGIPLVACSSLELLGAPHARSGRPVAAVVDARRGEVFWALYRGVVAATEPAVASPADLAEALAGVVAGSDGAGTAPAVLATGDGAARYRDVLEAVAGVEVAGAGWEHPNAAVLAEMAAGRSPTPPGQLTPMYLRGADVRVGWAVRHG
ncbi:MAG: tRNA (adenosine(37)-N6)-threonylcarbamoyltransferase complex dimerization subunit type 1 TsaB [Acidimicrobiales bacterium]